MIILSCFPHTKQYTLLVEYAAVVMSCGYPPPPPPPRHPNTSIQWCQKRSWLPLAPSHQRGLKAAKTQLISCGLGRPSRTHLPLASDAASLRQSVASAVGWHLYKEAASVGNSGVDNCRCTPQVLVAELPSLPSVSAARPCQSQPQGRSPDIDYRPTFPGVSRCFMS